MTAREMAGMTYAERIETYRELLDERRERYKRNVAIACQTLGFAICVSAYILFSMTAIGSAYVGSPSSKFVASAQASAR